MASQSGARAELGLGEAPVTESGTQIRSQLRPEEDFNLRLTLGHLLLSPLIIIIRAEDQRDGRYDIGDDVTLR